MNNKYYKPILFAVTISLVFIISACNNQEKETSTSNKFESISKDIQKMIEATNTPSLSIGIAQDGIIVWEESFGLANREKQIKATPQTIYSLASVSKPMTATAMMILVEKGLIDLNDSINKYLNDSKITIYEGNTKDATISRLLHHTAGLPTIWNFYFDGAKILRPNISKSIEQFGFISTPAGTAFEYSNLGYGIAEHIIENVSGEKYPEFMKTEVFQPLGMNQSFVITDKIQYDSIAPRYLENKNISPYFDVMSNGGGGICATTHDLLLFGMFHLKNHLPSQKKILLDTTISLMQSNKDSKVVHSNYRLGWNETYIHGYNVISHGGGMPGVSSVLMLIPSENIAISILSNGTYIDLNSLAYRIMKDLLPEKDSQINSAKEIIKNSYSLDDYAGNWIGEIVMDTSLIPIKIKINNEGYAEIVLTDNDGLSKSTGTFHLNNDFLFGSFDISINAKETSICRHKVNIKLRMKSNILSGYVAAESYRVEIFYLPYFVRLERH